MFINWGGVEKILYCTQYTYLVHLFSLCVFILLHCMTTLNLLYKNFNVIVIYCFKFIMSVCSFLCVFKFGMFIDITLFHLFTYYNKR